MKAPRNYQLGLCAALLSPFICSSAFAFDGEDGEQNYETFDDGTSSHYEANDGDLHQAQSASAPGAATQARGIPSRLPTNLDEHEAVLSDHGEFFFDPQLHDWVWLPSDRAVAPDFVPYDGSDGGRWLSTRRGLLYQSPVPWGIAFHHGLWFRYPPSYSVRSLRGRWGCQLLAAPALNRALWRENGSYIGVAPMPPRIYRGRVGPLWWTFFPRHRFGLASVYRYRLPRVRARGLYRSTRPHRVVYRSGSVRWYRGPRLRYMRTHQVSLPRGPGVYRFRMGTGGQRVVFQRPRRPRRRSGRRTVIIRSRRPATFVNSRRRGPRRQPRVVRTASGRRLTTGPRRRRSVRVSAGVGVRTGPPGRRRASAQRYTARRRRVLSRRQYSAGGRAKRNNSGRQGQRRRRRRAASPRKASSAR